MPGPLPTACLPLERLTPRALYVHLPFCARRCPYCDFATAPLDAAREGRYLGALELELRARAPTGFRPWTVYLGGGTPTELTTPGIERLVELLRPYVADAREVTVEANPAVCTICWSTVGGKPARRLDPNDSPTPPVPATMPGQRVTFASTKRNNQ